MNPWSIFRHALAFLFLFLAWKQLSQWYLYRSVSDFLLYFCFFCGALILASFQCLRRYLWQKRVLYLIPVLAIVLIPWGEFFRLNYPNTREDWARQIFFNALFLYCSLLVFQFLRVIPKTLHGWTSKILDQFSGSPARLMLPVFLLLILTSGICCFVYLQTPAVNDGAAYLFQAKIFEAGKLFAPAPPHPDFFNYEYDMLIMKDGRWFSMFPPGFSLLLAAAMLIKAEWFLDPFLGACTLAIWIEFARRWHNRQVAALFGVLCLFSPFFFQMYSTVIVHGLELFLATAVIYLCRRETETKTISRNVLLFVVILISVLVRAFSLMIFLAPVLLYTAWDSVKRRSPYFLIATAAGVVAGSLLLGFYHWKITGHPMMQPYSLEYPDLKYGFGKHFAGLTHSPARAVEQLSNSLLGLNKWLNGWYSGSLFFLIAFFLTVRKLQKWDILLLLCCFSLLCFYFFYIAQDLIFGPRFLFLCAPILLLFIARTYGVGDKPECGPAGIQLGALLVVCFLAFLPANLPKFIWIYDPANDPPEYLAIKIKEVRPEKKILFLDPELPQDFINWNDPFLRDPLLFCRDLASRNDEILASFPEYYPVYLRFKNLSLKDANSKETLGFFDRPGEANDSHINFYDLVSALHYSKTFTDLDSFDVTYPRLFFTHSASPKLVYLEEMLSRTQNESSYRDNFKRALVHTARMLLLPRLAYEKGGFGDWRSYMDFERFRSDLNQAQTFFARSGPLGSFLHQELYKVRKRIDGDSDNILSDAECARFLSEKILLFARFV